MPEDRSLDEFASFDGEDAGPESDGDEDAEGAPADSDPTSAPSETTPDSEPSESETDPESPATEPDPVPATPTADWTAGGADCERCGATAERRWLDDGTRVCADCKEW